MSLSLLKVKGVKCSSIASGIKMNGNLDLSLISLIKGSNTAAVFTQNIFSAAPVIVAKNHLNSNVEALLINSGNANAGTGHKGIEDTYKTCEYLASELQVMPEQVLPFSTGVIGEFLPLEAFKSNVNLLVSSLSKEGMSKVARGILTTDLVEKSYSTSINIGGKTVNLSGIAKGSGMIRPDMATMLSFIVSDIGASKEELQECLTVAVNQSFNRITVDGDTSTNDACSLSATNQSGVQLSQCKDEFQKALNLVSKELSQMIVKDGEGATKFISINIKNASSLKEAKNVGMHIGNSLLVKTALFAEDANWGRILSAIGNSEIKLVKKKGGKSGNYKS